MTTRHFYTYTGLLNADISLKRVRNVTCVIRKTNCVLIFKSIFELLKLRTRLLKFSHLIEKSIALKVLGFEELKYISKN